MAHGINITNKKSTKGRNATPHVARKLSMPFPDGMNNIEDDYKDIKRTYSVRKRHGNKVVEVVHESDVKPKPKNRSTNFNMGEYRDEIKKGKWF